MPAWRRVRDVSTGHQYDIDARLPLPDGVQAVERFPILDGPGARPRKAKPHTDKGTIAPVRARRMSQTKPAPETEAPAIVKENKNG